MPPIPVYTASPINAAKASGVTPKTASPDEDNNTPLGQRYAPVQPTPTQTVPGYGGDEENHNNTSPPPPQPGAVPHLPQYTATATPTSTSSLPPPPKAGESLYPHLSPAPQPPAPTQAAQLPGTGTGMGSTATYPPPPAQMAIPPPPTMPYTAQRGTATATTSGGGYPPTSLPGIITNIDDNLAHPPGYQQNVSAVEFSAHQRAAQEAAIAEEQQRRRNSLSALGGLGGGGGDGDGDGVWNSAKKWIQAAGEKLSDAETEVWRRISKE